MAFKMNGWSAFTKETRMEGPRNKRTQKKEKTTEGETNEEIDNPSTARMTRSLQSRDYYPQTNKDSRLEYEPQSQKSDEPSGDLVWNVKEKKYVKK